MVPTRLFPDRLRSDETGIALITVIVISVVLFSLVAATAVFALGSLDVSRRDQDWNAALASAEAGIDDYLYRLNRDGGYWAYNAENPPPDGNQAFETWVGIPGGSIGKFRYYVDTSLATSQGIIKVKSSGKVKDVVRTVEALVRRRGFLDYLYFTEYETTDPAAYTGFPFTPQQAQDNCAHHYYDQVGRHENCSDIYFAGQDTLSGPVHTNDALLFSGSPNFTDELSTSWDGTCPGGTDCTASADRYRGTANPLFARPGDPAYASPLTLPPSNTSLKSKADAGLGGVGCLFTGPTKIKLNSTGTMDVTSPLTKVSNCQVGANKPLPSNGVIYVQSVPTSSSDPNYTSTCPVGSGNPLGYPIADDVNTAQYGCFDGDVFISGTLDGALTVGAQDSVIIIGDTVYKDGTGGDDIMGLIADNYVEVYHPVKCTSYSSGVCSGSQNLTGAITNPDIHGALLTLKHSFRVQSYRLGAPLGDLTIFGSIGQLYRGAVGTFSGGGSASGYDKVYLYDQKLKYTSPPSFLDAVASAWWVRTWAECDPADPPTASSCA